MFLLNAKFVLVKCSNIDLLYPGPIFIKRTMARRSAAVRAAHRMFLHPFVYKIQRGFLDIHIKIYGCMDTDMDIHRWISID